MLNKRRSVREANEILPSKVAERQILSASYNLCYYSENKTPDLTLNIPVAKQSVRWWKKLSRYQDS